jgi:hypothetical protein
MSLLDTLLQQAGGSDALAGLAGKLGLPADQVQSLGNSLLAKMQGGASAEQAAADTAAEAGVDADQLHAMVPAIADHVGADGADGLMAKLGGTGGILGSVGAMLDRDGDGSPLNDVLGMAKGLFGKT